MDKNNIKNRLTQRFLSEESTPGIKVTADMKKKSGVINKKGVGAEAKDAIDYNKSLKQDSDTSKMADNKVNYTDDYEKTYHDEMEIMNGQEMVQYDRKPNQLFQEKAEEAIAGSSRMGNNPEWANVVDKQKGFEGPDFGKNLVKKIKASEKKRSEQTPTLNLRGANIQADMKDTGHKPYAFEKSVNEMATPKNPISEKTTQVLTAWVAELGAQKAAEKLINKLSQTGMISDLPDSMEYGAGLNRVSTLLQKGDLNSAYHAAKALATRLEKKAMKDMGLFENNNNKPQIKESMKRLKFKKEFNGVGNALKMIPESYKVDAKEFEMTDGNETYRIRWEGTLSEGAAVVVTANDKKMVNEDIQRMKALFGYKSQDTLGLVKGNARLDENKVFGDIWNKSKRLLGESEEIEGQTADKTAPFEEAGVKQASDAKKHIQGSVSTDKGTTAPKPKTGNWEDNVKGQAAEAKKHVEGSVSTDKGTTAPKPKEGEWDEIENSAPEATEHMESGTSTNKATNKAKVVNENVGEEDEEEEDDYNKPDEDDDSSMDAEPSANELPSELELGDDEEDAVKVPAPTQKSGDATILYSASADEYWIQSPSIPTGRMKVPDQYISIASDKSKKAGQRAEMILDMIENEEEEIDEYGDEHAMSTDDAVSGMGADKKSMNEAVSPEKAANLEKQFDELNGKNGGKFTAQKNGFMEKAKGDNFLGSFKVAIAKRTGKPIMTYSAGQGNFLNMPATGKESGYTEQIKK
jgi:hypothetical protein